MFCLERPQVQFAYLIKLAIIATNELIEHSTVVVRLCAAFQYSATRFVPESRILACLIICVSERVIQVSLLALVNDFVLFRVEGSGCVQETIETNQIGQPESYQRLLIRELVGETHVAPVLSSRTYIPRLWISSIAARHSVIVARW